MKNNSQRFLSTIIVVLALTLLVAAPAGAYTFWEGYHLDHQTEVWVNPNCIDSSAGSPEDQVRSVMGGDVAGGADGWSEQVSSGWLGFCFAGTTTLDQVDVADGINLVFWRNIDGNGATALTYCDGTSVDNGFDVVLFDEAWAWAHDNYGPGTDIKGVMTHEFGHALGLGHSGDFESTMWPYLKNDGTANRVLSTDDGLGLKVLYGFTHAGADPCLYAPGASTNDLCETAVELFPGQPVDGDTIWALNDYDPGAGACIASALPGPDAVYRVWLDLNQQLDVLVDTLSPGYDPAIYLVSWNGTPDVSCLAGADAAAGGGDESFSYTATEAGDYYLIIDSTYNCGMESSGRFQVSIDITVGSPSTVAATLSCSTSSSTLPCGVNLTVEVLNLTAETRRYTAQLDLDAAGGQTFSNVRRGSVNIGAGLTFTRDLVINLPAVGSLDGSNSFVLVVVDTTPGNPSPVAGDRAVDSCAVVTTLG